MYKHISYQTAHRTATITLNRPDKRNALNAAIVTDLINAFDATEKDDDLKVIVLTGAGKAFCAGADLASLQALQQNSYDENLADSKHLAALFRRIYLSSKPVIARINGHALAGGCGLAAVCDLSVSVEQAKFGYTEVRIGFVPAIVSWFLMQKISGQQARRLLLTGEIIGADKALSYGLINEVVATEQALDEQVTAWCNMLSEQNSGQAMASTKKLLALLPGKDLYEAMNLTGETNAHARHSDDCKRGIAAFLNKEKITW